MSTAYSRPAAKGITQAARSEHDFAGWLAVVLATAAAATGSGRAGRRPPRIVRGQPGDAARARHVGWDDEYLPVRSRAAQLRQRGLACWNSDEVFTFGRELTVWDVLRACPQVKPPLPTPARSRGCSPTFRR
jgi:hypothetical protein